MSILKVSCAYDSHTHWLATGGKSVRLDLSSLRSPQDLKNLTIKPHHFRREWLVGFGWDQNKWPDSRFPSREMLDQFFPNVPVAFSRADGHASWLNTKALKKIGWLNEQEEKAQLPTQFKDQIILDKDGLPQGVCLDNAKTLVDQSLPAPSSDQIRSELLEGMQIFNSQGFTHIRDLTGTEAQWNETVRLFESSHLTLAVEQFFIADNLSTLKKTIDLALKAKKENLSLVRVKGVKIFFDGALGSEGALLSQPYQSGSGCGFALMSTSDMKEAIQQVWNSGLEIAVHTIGDEAAHRVVQIAHELVNEGHSGHLHLEHVELLRPETIRLMKSLHVTCHLQPCHWLSDRAWLKQKIGHLIQYAFPWRSLEEHELPFYFGSDSPIEPPNLASNLLALRESSQYGIPSLKRNPMTYHSHPDKDWVKDCYSVWKEDSLVQVVFNGQNLK